MPVPVLRVSKGKVCVEKAIETAKRELKERGELIPAAILKINGGAIVIPVAFTCDEEQKILYNEILPFIIKTHGAKEAIIVLEMQFNSVPKNDKSVYIGSSNAPNKKECITVTHITPDSVNTTIIPFERSEEGIVFGKQINADKGKYNLFISCIEALKEVNNDVMFL